MQLINCEIAGTKPIFRFFVEGFRETYATTSSDNFQSLALSLLEMNLKKSRFCRRGVPAEETKQQKRLCGLWCYRRYLR